MTLKLVTAPTTSPLDTSAAKAQCRVDGSEEDAVIQAYVEAAEGYLEQLTGRQFRLATWDATWDGFPWWFDLPKAPLKSVTSVKYLDADGVEQTLSPSAYRVTGDYGTDEPNPTAARGRLTQAYGTVWPSARCEADSVTVRLVAGYGTANKVPAALIQAQLLLVSHWYRNREPVSISSGASALEIPFAVEALIGPYRTWPIEGTHHAGSWGRRWPAGQAGYGAGAW